MSSDVTLTLITRTSLLSKHPPLLSAGYCVQDLVLSSLLAQPCRPANHFSKPSHLQTLNTAGLTPVKGLCKARPACLVITRVSNQSQTIRQSLAQMENIYIYISKNIYAQDGWISKSLPCLVERMVTRVKTNSSSCWKRQDQHQTAVSTTGNYFIFSWWGQPTDTACSVLVELLLVENTEASNKSWGEEIKEERHEPEHSA